MLCDQSPDPALNCNIRPLSMADSKYFLEKRRGVLHRAPCDARVVEGTIHFAKSPIISPPRNSFGIVVFFPLPSQLESCPESCDSPRISARQEIVSGK